MHYTWGRGQNNMGIAFGVPGADLNGGILVSNAQGAVQFPALPLHDVASASFELTTAAGTRTIVVTAADNVVGGTKVWTFANGAFTADDIGGTITVAGASNGANNGTFTISAQTATTVTTGGTPTNETFTTPTNLTVTSIGVTITAGAWTIQASNSYANGELNQIDAAGTWTDITAQFTAIAALTGNQTRFTMSTIGLLSARAIRPVLTLTAAGRTRAIALAFAKGGS